MRAARLLSVVRQGRLLSVLLCAAAGAASPARSLPIFEERVLGADAWARGGAGTAWEGGAMAFLRNPSLLAGPPGWDIAAGYAVLYGLPEVAHGAASVSSRRWSGGWGLALDLFGNDLYRETRFGVSAARSLSRACAGGAAVNVHHLAVEGVGGATAIGIDLGVRVVVGHGAMVGARWRNANAQRLGRGHEPLPRSLSIGGAFRVAERLAIVVDARGEPGFTPGGGIGLEISPVSIVTLRAGVAWGPPAAAIGIAIHRGPVEWSYALWHHLDLGASHGTELRWRGGEPSPGR